MRWFSCGRPRRRAGKALVAVVQEAIIHGVSTRKGDETRDAAYVKVRENGRVTRRAWVVAVAVNEQGERRVPGLDLGPAEQEPFGLQFPWWNAAGKGVQQVSRDAHVGLKKAIAAVPGAGSARP